MEKMTLSSQGHITDHASKRSKSFKREKQKFSDLDEIGELRLQLNKSKHDNIVLMSKHNEELLACENHVTRLRCEVEKGDAVRQSLEYDLAVARKECSMERMALEEEKAKAIRVQEHFKEQIEELHRKMQTLQEHFQTTEFSWQDARKALESDLQIRDQAIENCRKEQEMLMVDKSKTEAVIQRQNVIIQEMQHKLHELSIENNTHKDTVRRHKSELGLNLEREERIKKEVEAARERVMKLEENIEAERAAHLESKFNSEVIQLRIRDLEASLEVERASQAETATRLELIKNQFKEVEIAYNREKSIAGDVTDKLQKLEKEYSFMMNEFKAEIENKNKLFTELSAKLSNYEENFALTEQNLAMTKKQQLSIEEAYGYIVKELQGLVESFSMLSLPASGTYNDNLKPTRPAVLEALRHTLTDYQNRLESTYNELENAKHVCEELKDEVHGSNQIKQSLHKKLENARSELTVAEKEMHYLSDKCAERESEIARLQKEFGKAQDAWEKEARRVLEAESEIQKISNTFQKDKEEKLTFLHSLYQRLVAGCVLIKQPECMLGNFSWSELCVVLQENVDILISDLNKTNDKVSHLKQVCNKKADEIIELQRNHENSLDQLAEQMKAQHSSWHTKTKDLEQHYSAFLGEAREKAQKYQKIAELLKDKTSISEKTKDQMAIENVRIKNVLINTEKDHKSLLAACALMAGALCPLYSRSCLLAAQKTLLQKEWNSCVDVQREIQNLVQTLSENVDKKKGDSWKKTQHSVHLKLLFRKSAIVVLAAKRLQRLGRSRQSLFTWVEKAKKRPGISVCIGQAQIIQKTYESMHCNEAGKWLTNTDLLSAVVTSMSELVGLLNNKGLNCSSQRQIIDAARNCFSKLMKKLNVETEYRTVAFGRHSIYLDTDSLAYRLSHGLHKISGRTPSVGLAAITPVKECLAALRIKIFEFTQRLHTSEVERRSMRRELLDMKQKFSERGKNVEKIQKLKEDGQHFERSKMVPYEKFKTAFEELNKTLQREQEVQMLLNEQSQQLLDLNYKIELHSKEVKEKDLTLSEAMKSLSEAQKELWRKDQSLHHQSSWLAKLEQDKRRLEESIASAEGALRAAARDKEILVSYMKSISAAFQKIHDEATLSRATSTKYDAPIQLPRLTPNMFEMEGNAGGPEFIMCQIMIRHFLDVYQIACTKAATLERKITLNEKHISTLKSELQSACLRESRSFSPEKCDVSTARNSRTDFFQHRTMQDFLPLKPEPDLSTSQQNYNYMNESFSPIADYSSHTDYTSTYMKELPKT
ncbi:PREDICTED: coiled-coil domain-containing protein 171 [Nanorana parkeri]|uniref:coiled-coil domain-containing protein 171 n=1 Tax=Nanorana parkeri TaxID=125878 RepID=UPI000854A112|nr:PREDICTED: coiled-coil domain-containing protein 171 [Nanorana parkeri]